ncbi:MAG: hypothetical protein RRA32_10040, partial [bacterium]|nr:hypothetical protein [bacterium]
MIGKMWISLTALILGLSLLVPALPVSAREMAEEGDLTRVRKKVEALRAWQLTEELNLDEETSARLFPAMREADQERQLIETRNRELVRELAREVAGEGSGPARIDEILDELTANRREMVQAEERHIKRVRQILDPVGTARYLMFTLRFEREMKQKAAEAFQERRRTGDGMDERAGPGDGSVGGGSSGSSGGGSDGGSGSGSGGGPGGPGGGGR